MALDFDGIATSLAALFASDGAPPAGETLDIRSSTANPPNVLGALPCVVVFSSGGAFPDAALQNRLGLLQFRVQFFLAQGEDLARDELRLRRWLGELLYRIPPAQVTLGGKVARSWITSYSVGQLAYGESSPGVPFTYSGIELLVSAATSEAWS